MKSYDLVSKTIRGENPGQTPLYGWVFDNVTSDIIERFGSLHAFEDHYRFDLAHIFGGPFPYEEAALDKLRTSGIEITPDVLLDIPMLPVNNMDDYQGIRLQLEHQRMSRDRFCYMQTNGIFECLNSVFGIENHLCYLAMYGDELKEVYQRQAQWNKQFALNICELGMDMIHVSDDWGAQKNLMFSPIVWKELIYPYHKITVDAVHKAGKFASLHSDGNINAVLDGVVALGYDLIHPYQESAGMDYSIYLEKYRDKFSIMGGICIQSTLGFGNYARLESEIRRVFETLKGQRWICCTTHLVQRHCNLDELVFAYDLARKLAD